MIEREEIWIPVVGYEREYLVSDCGSVKRTDSNHELKQRIDGRGYPTIILYSKGERKSMRVHRVVAMAFLRNALNMPQVNHKDEDKKNNSVSNLEWCSNRYNNRYGTVNKRRSESLKKYYAERNTISEWRKALNTQA